MLMWVQRNVAVMVIFCCALSACTKVDPSLTQQLQLQSIDPSLPPYGFNILGASGNLDLISDVNLFSTTSPIISWSVAGGAQSYDVSILDSITNAVVCQAVETGTSHYFAGCVLADGSTYKIKITASNANGTTDASNNEMIFSVDNTAPSVLSVNAEVTPAYWKAGDTVDIDVHFSEPLVVNGSDLALVLNTLPSRSADFVNVDTGGTMKFRYIVQAGDSSTLLSHVGVNSLSIVTSTTTVTDEKGNLASLVLPAAGTTGAMDITSAVVIDTIAPVVALDAPTAMTLSQWGSTDIAMISTGADTVNGDPAQLSIANSGTASCSSISKTGSGALITWRLSNCAGDGAVTIAVLPGTASDSAGNLSVASNSVIFTVDNTAPSAFSISGITGGADATLDDMLTDGDEPTIAWSASAGATAYYVSVNSADDLTVLCPAQYTIGTAFSFTGCHLSSASYYRAHVQAFDDANNGTTASYDFMVVSTPQSLSVSAYYSTNGRKWNDYVVNDGVDVLSASGAACNSASSVSYKDCFHAGEMRVASTFLTSCANAMATDSGGAFDWACRMNGSTATFVSTGLKTGQGLANLIDFTAPAWKANVLTVTYNGQVVGQSSTLPWWTNTVTNFPTASPTTIQSLSTSGSIYVLGSNFTVRGASIPADKVALVTAPGATLTFDQGATAACTGLTALVCTSSRSYLWIEGNFAGYSGTSVLPAKYTIYASATKHSRFNNIATSNFDTVSSAGSALYFAGSLKNRITNFTAVGQMYSGLYLNASHYNLIANFSLGSPSTFPSVFIGGSNYNEFADGHLDNALKTTGGGGVYLSASSNNSFNRFKIASAASFGLEAINASNSNTFRNFYIANTFNGSGVIVSDSSSNKLDQFTISQSYSNGVILGGSSVGSNDNRFSRFSILSSNINGILFSGPSFTNNSFSFVTILNSGSGYYGISLASNSVGTVLNQILTLNNKRGIAVNNAQDMIISQYAGMNFNSAYTAYTGGLYFSDSANNVASGNSFYGNILFSGSNSCDGYSADGVLSNALCNGGGPSGAANFLVNVPSMSTSIVGKLADFGGGDSSNPLGSSLISYSSLVTLADWTNFSNSFRAWGKSGSIFPDGTSAQMGLCGSGLCGIWDLRLRDSATVLLGTSGSGYDSSQNEPFIEGGACPRAVEGNRVIVSSTKTFLMNAVESFTEGGGNHDGLCESGETCIYQPNFGSYLGEGVLTNPCVFQDGAVYGVIMKAHVQNGASLGSP